jgi:hypothetical protein
MIQVKELVFNSFQLVANRPAYYGSDNVVFQMQVGDKLIGEIVKLPGGELQLTYNPVIEPYGFSSQSKGLQTACTLEDYTEMCNIVSSNYTNYLEYLSTAGYRTEPRGIGE